MRIKPLMRPFLLILVGISVFAAGSQSALVKAKFEIDGKESKDKFRIVLYADGVATEPTLSDDGSFSVPALTVQKVDVRLLSGQYNLLYENVYLTKLRGTLTFGVKEHLSTEDSHCKRGQELMSSYSLNFEPDDAEGTGMVVEVCK
jgi:hypothetical protein